MFLPGDWSAGETAGDLTDELQAQQGSVLRGVVGRLVDGVVGGDVEVFLYYLINCRYRFRHTHKTLSLARY